MANDGFVWILAGTREYIGWAAGGVLMGWLRAPHSHMPVPSEHRKTDAPRITPLDAWHNVMLTSFGMSTKLRKPLNHARITRRKKREWSILYSLQGMFVYTVVVIASGEGGL